VTTLTIDRRNFIKGTLAAAIAAGSAAPLTAAASTGRCNLEVGRHARVWGADGELFEIRAVDNQVVRLSPDGRTTLWVFGSPDDHTTLNHPVQAAVGPAGRLFVVDRGNHRVVVLGPNGRRLGTIGSVGSGPGQLDSPIDIAIDRRGIVHVLDPFNQRVQRFETSGRPAGVMPLDGSDDSPSMNHPLAADFDVDGNLHVADFDGSIAVLDPDGHAVARYGSKLRAPRGVAVDEQRNSFVAERFDGVVQVFASDGTPLERRAIWLEGRSAHPTHLAWAPDGSIYVRALPGA